MDIILENIYSFVKGYKHSFLFLFSFYFETNFVLEYILYGLNLD